MSKHTHNFYEECDMKRQVKPTWQWFPAVIGVVFGVIAVALPAYGDTFRILGFSAEAFFESIDETQCVRHSVFIAAQDFEFRLVDPPSSHGPQPDIFLEAFADIRQFDFCSSTPLFSASCFAPLADGDFLFEGPNLDSATLNTTLSCFDSVSDTSFDLFVNMGWLGVGDPSREPVNFRVQEEGLFSVLAAIDTHRSAEASGSVSDGVTNFTPDATAEASMRLTKAANIAIER